MPIKCCQGIYCQALGREWNLINTQEENFPAHTGGRGRVWNGFHGGLHGHVTWAAAQCLQRALLGLILCCCSLEVLNNFIFDPVFCTWSLMRQWNMHVGRGNAHNMWSAGSLHISLSSAPGAGLWWSHNSWKVRDTQREHTGKHVSTRLSRRASGLSLRGHTLHLNQNLLWAQKKSSAVLRNKNNQEILHNTTILSCVTSLC